MAKSSRGGKYSVGTSKNNRLENLIKISKDMSIKPNVILNQPTDESALGSTFQSLNYNDKSTIKGLLAVTKKDAQTIADNLKYGIFLERGVRVSGTRYIIRIQPDLDKNDLTYTVKRGNKFIVKNGSYINAANQLAIIAKKRY